MNGSSALPAVLAFSCGASFAELAKETLADQPQPKGKGAKAKQNATN